MKRKAGRRLLAWVPVILLCTGGAAVYLALRKPPFSFLSGYSSSFPTQTFFGEATVYNIHVPQEQIVERMKSELNLHDLDLERGFNRTWTRYSRREGDGRLVMTIRGGKAARSGRFAGHGGSFTEEFLDVGSEPDWSHVSIISEHPWHVWLEEQLEDLGF